MTASRAVTPDRVVAVLALVLAVAAPLYVSNYWLGQLLTQMLFLGIAAASLIFLSAYGGMVSLAQVSIYGIAGFVVGNVTTNGNTKGLNLGWSPYWGVVVGHPHRGRDGASLREPREPQRRHLLLDDHPHVFGDRQPLLRSGDGCLRLRGYQRHPRAVGDRQRRRAHQSPVLRHARRGAGGVCVVALPRANTVRADAARRSRRPDSHGFARLQRSAASNHRIRVRRRSSPRSPA